MRSQFNKKGPDAQTPSKARDRGPMRSSFDGTSHRSGIGRSQGLVANLGDPAWKADLAKGGKGAGKKGRFSKNAGERSRPARKPADVDALLNVGAVLSKPKQ